MREAYQNLDMNELTRQVMVRSVRRALITTIARGLLSDEELHTALVQAEHMINSRPRTTVSPDPDDLNPLTPSHFLVRRVDVLFALDIEEAVHPQRRWLVLQHSRVICGSVG